MKLVAWKYFSVIMTLVLALGTGVVALMPAPVTAAAKPTVTGINPSSGKQGDSSRVFIITGTNFSLDGGATEVYIEDGNGVAIIDITSGFTVVSDTQISLSFAIPATARPGSGYVSVKNTAG